MVPRCGKWTSSVLGVYGLEDEEAWGVVGEGLRGRLVCRPDIEYTSQFFLTIYWAQLVAL